MLARVHDVTVRRRGLQALFGAGDVLLSTGGDRAVVLPDVPVASLVQRMLSEQLSARGAIPSPSALPGAGLPGGGFPGAGPHAGPRA